jgi:NhaP-type Na+/H+ or K+/H+ antiporter
MTLTAVFIVVVFLYSLVSRRMERTVITAPIIFTTAGLLIFLMPPWLSAFDLNRKLFLLIAEIGLVMTLFTEAADISLRLLKRNRRLVLPVSRQLLTFSVRWYRVVVGGLSLWEAGILAAILAPTDAGLGQVIVNSPRVPMNIRQALSVEAGLNDGLSVPFLMVFIALALHTAEGAGAVLLRFLWEQIGYGRIGLGINGWGLVWDRLRMLDGARVAATRPSEHPLLCVVSGTRQLFMPRHRRQSTDRFAEAGERSQSSKSQLLTSSSSFFSAYSSHEPGRVSTQHWRSMRFSA